jgi:hypothetical protein
MKEPCPYKNLMIKDELEELLQRPVDVVRKREKMNLF